MVKQEKNIENEEFFYYKYDAFYYSEEKSFSFVKHTQLQLQLLWI